MVEGSISVQFAIGEQRLVKVMIGCFDAVGGDRGGFFHLHSRCPLTVSHVACPKAIIHFEKLGANIVSGLIYVNQVSKS